MRDTDIDELEALLGRAKPAYEALRHETPLDPDRAVEPPRRHLRRYAIAASVVLAVSAIAYDLILPTASGPASRLAFERPQSVPLTLRPAGHAFAQLTVSRPRPGPTRLRLPRRPAGSNG